MRPKPLSVESRPAHRLGSQDHEPVEPAERCQSFRRAIRVIFGDGNEPTGYEVPFCSVCVYIILIFVRDSYLLQGLVLKIFRVEDGYFMAGSNWDYNQNQEKTLWRKSFMPAIKAQFVVGIILMSVITLLGLYRFCTNPESFFLNCPCRSMVGSLLMLTCMAGDFICTTGLWQALDEDDPHDADPGLRNVSIGHWVMFATGIPLCMACFRAVFEK
uniref:Uncharacterized protein n=1 Tax=Octactis speculum TaxID=3111310 RepID=A0A7S2BJI8_9STRA|mmetsp:Transcript_24002/g.32808  ORF Transcript_24002/g.32808 Transcript_24002/m.32808 type:complete len:215 (+) Transcript_24002:94-738(+)